jgi:hypothetical protein
VGGKWKGSGKREGGKREEAGEAGGKEGGRRGEQRTDLIVGFSWHPPNFVFFVPLVEHVGFSEFSPAKRLPRNFCEFRPNSAKLFLPTPQKLCLGLDPE